MKYVTIKAAEKENFALFLAAPNDPLESSIDMHENPDVEQFIKTPPLTNPDLPNPAQL